MIWCGKELATIGDLEDAVMAIVREGTREDAEVFMRQYAEENPAHARTNIGYLAGYHGAETARKVWDWFGCEHPIFGTEIPSFEKALEAGKRMAAGEFDS